jgi:hypothetical protein
MKIIFSNYYEAENSKISSLEKNKFRVELTSDEDPTLAELLELFENFILACGYRLPDGHKIDATLEDF